MSQEGSYPESKRQMCQCIILLKVKNTFMQHLSNGKLKMVLVLTIPLPLLFVIGGILIMEKIKGNEHC